MSLKRDHMMGPLATRVAQWSTCAVHPWIMSTFPGLDCNTYFLIPKRGSSSLRPILDLCVLNRHLRKYTFRMLTHKVLCRSIRPGVWFVTIDLSDAYFQHLSRALEISPVHVSEQGLRIPSSLGFSINWEKIHVDPLQCAEYLGLHHIYSLIASHTWNFGQYSLLLNTSYNLSGAAMSW